MNEEQPKNKRRKIERQQVVSLAALMLSFDEIGNVVGCSGNHVRTKYARAVEEGRAEGKKSLRRAQFEKALAGDTRMLIFLGKNYLGQSDDGDQGESNQPLPWEEAE